MEQQHSGAEFFIDGNGVADLGLIATPGAHELTALIDSHLVRWANRKGLNKETFIIPSECPRFSSGDGKGVIKNTVRGDDLYFVVDVGNYSCKYRLFGSENSMSPDDHYQDLKRLIQAASGKAHRITVIMPLLYGSRQHRRTYRESLDCAYALQELQSMGVANIITFDAHDPRVSNAVPLMGMDNVMPTYQVMKAMFKHIPDFKPTPDSFMVISPDEGAINRNMYYASVLGVNLGMFYKRRDYSRVVNGRNPIVAHEYLGESVEGKDVFIADDIISSGESMLDIGYELKKRGAKRIFCNATYAIFTAGLAEFDKAYADGIISGVFGTNLTYRTPELLSREWFHEVDVSKYIAYFVAAINHDMSVSSIIDPHAKIEALLQRYGVK
ncbi:MAG TPA: ribose-phosphate pyrophosphokinase [Candidatus Fournierella excrementavium]|uniref:ribose-phosphate pyrophosphokinase n=1 Tax=Candidatus Allofournierella excrementavium TaxID=2838591 RepID=UPI001FA51E27|nr:ribose-phosphate pyrophosphokinase [Candidatus Fournierella excrementavium]